jgi:DNA-binding transcriptional regulator LsrR (DeoR family)
MAEENKQSRRYRAPYQKARIARLAYLAGVGCSAGEIAEEMHISERHVYRMLSEYRITLAPKAPGQKALSVAVSDTTFARAHELAGELEIDPRKLVTKLLEAVIAERTVSLTLLDGARLHR